MKNINYSILVLFLFFLISDCRKNKESNPCDIDFEENVPEMLLESVLQEGTKVKIKGNISNVGKDEEGIVEYGVCFAIGATPTLQDSCLVFGSTESPTIIEKDLEDFPAGNYQFILYYKHCTGTWLSEGEALNVLEVYNPSFVIVNEYFSDENGNNNSIINQGENIQYQFRLKNEGNILAENIQVSAKTSTPEVINNLNTDVTEMGNLPVGSFSEFITYDFNLAEEVSGNYCIDIDITSNEGYEEELHLCMDVFKNVIADFEITTGLGNCSAPCELQFDASNSVGENLTYLWTFGDGNSTTGNIVSNTYQLADTFLITLTVTGDGGEASKDTTIITEFKTFFEFFGQTIYNEQGIGASTYDGSYKILTSWDDPFLGDFFSVALWDADLDGIITEAPGFPANGLVHSVKKNNLDNFILTTKVGFDEGVFISEVSINGDINSSNFRDEYLNPIDVISKNNGDGYLIVTYCPSGTVGCTPRFAFLIDVNNSWEEIRRDSFLVSPGFVDFVIGGVFASANGYSLLYNNYGEGAAMVFKQIDTDLEVFADNEFGGSGYLNAILHSSNVIFALVQDSGMEKIMKINLNGNLVDFFYTDFTSSNIGDVLIKETLDNNLIICGKNSDDNIFISKIDLSNNMTLWSREHGDSQANEIPKSIEVLQDGGYLIVGERIESGGDSDVFILKTDNEGKLN